MFHPYNFQDFVLNALTKVNSNILAASSYIDMGKFSLHQRMGRGYCYELGLLETLKLGKTMLFAYVYIL